MEGITTPTVELSNMQCIYPDGMGRVTASIVTRGKRYQDHQNKEGRQGEVGGYLEQEEPTSKRTCRDVRNSSADVLSLKLSADIIQLYPVRRLDTMEFPKLNISDPIIKTAITHAKRLMLIWIDELLSHHGSIVQEGYESSFAVQSLLYLRTRWYMRTEGRVQLPLGVASWIWENKLLEICNWQRIIFGCRFCDAPKRTLDSIFTHFANLHPERCTWQFLKGNRAHSSDADKDWTLALWPEFLPIRVKFEPQLQKSLRTHMMDAVHRLSELGGVPESILIYLWFRLSLEWQIKAGKSFPSLEKFIKIAIIVQKDTNHPMFGALRCGSCGSRGSMVNTYHHKDGDGFKRPGRYEKPWIWKGLGDHIKNQHNRPHLPWKELLIYSPTWAEVLTSCSKIESMEIRQKFISLWNELDEEMAAEMEGIGIAGFYVDVHASEYFEPDSLVADQQARLKGHAQRVNPNPGLDWGFIDILGVSGAPAKSSKR